MGYFIRAIVFLAIVMFVCSPIGPVFAQGFENIFDKKLPIFSGISNKEFDNLARTHTKDPFADKALNYEIKLPSIWKEDKSFGYSISEGIFTDIGRYSGPPKFNKASSYVVIKAMQVGLQASAKTMAASIFMTSGFTVHGAEAHSRNDIETMHVEVDKGESYIVRSVFLINGGRLVVMSYYLPQSSWKEERDQQYRVVESFRLVNKVETKLTDVKQYDFWDVASIRFPKKWNIEPSPEQTLDHMSILLLNTGGGETARSKDIIKGRMTLDLISRYLAPNLDDLIAEQLDNLISQGIVIERRIDNPDDLEWPEGFEATDLYAYNVIDSYSPNEQTELWLVGAKIYGHNYVLSLVTPSRSQNFLLWGENTEALRYLVSSVQAHSDW